RQERLDGDAAVRRDLSEHDDETELQGCEGDEHSPKGFFRHGGRAYRRVRGGGSGSACARGALAGSAPLLDFPGRALGEVHVVGSRAAGAELLALVEDPVARGAKFLDPLPTEHHSSPSGISGGTPRILRPLLTS